MADMTSSRLMICELTPTAAQAALTSCSIKAVMTQLPKAVQQMENHGWVQCCMSPKEFAHCFKQHGKHQGTVLIRHDIECAQWQHMSLIDCRSAADTTGNCNVKVLYHSRHRQVCLPLTSHTMHATCVEALCKAHCVGFVHSNKQLLQKLGRHPLPQAVNPSLHECRVQALCASVA